jgi:hypothetical protein
MTAMDRLARAETETEVARSFGPHIGGQTGEWALFRERVRDDPLAAWVRLLHIVAITDADSDLWVADILEALVQADHPTFVPMLEGELASNRRLRDAYLHFVPSAPDEDVNDRLLELRENLERSP